MLRWLFGVPSIPVEKPTPSTLVLNNTEELLLVQIEPWGEDYWVNPGDECKLVGDCAGSDGQFIVGVHDTGLAIWAEGNILSVEVQIGGEVVCCGHNRPEGWP